MSTSIWSRQADDLFPADGVSVLSHGRRRGPPATARSLTIAATIVIGLALAASLYASFATTGTFDLAASLYASFATTGTFDLATAPTIAGHRVVSWVAPDGPASAAGVVVGAVVVNAIVGRHASPSYVLVAGGRRTILNPRLLIPTTWDLLDAVLGLGMLLLGLVVRFNSATPAAGAFWRLSVLASLSLALNPATTHGTSLALVLQAVALRLFGPALLALALSFPSRHSRPSHPWRILLCWLPALLLVAAYPFYWASPAPLSTIMPKADGVLLACYILAACAYVAYALLRPLSSRQRARLHWLAIGLLGGLLPFEILTLLPLVLVGRAVLAPEASILALTLLPVCVAVAILRVDILGAGVSLRFVMRVLVAITLLAGSTGISAVLAMEAVGRWDWPLPVVGVVISLLSALLVTLAILWLASRRGDVRYTAGDQALIDAFVPPSAGALNQQTDTPLAQQWEPEPDELPAPMEDHDRDGDTSAIGDTADAILTARELEVLEHLAAGSSNREIAQRLGLKVKTVEKHITSILAKLDAQSRLQAVTIAHHRHILPPD